MRESGIFENGDIVKQAQLIIDRYAGKISSPPEKKKRKKHKEYRLWFLAGAATSAALFFAIFLRIY